jgi:hypothetical protein
MRIPLPWIRCRICDRPPTSDRVDREAVAFTCSWCLLYAQTARRPRVEHGERPARVRAAPRRQHRRLVALLAVRIASLRAQGEEHES